MRRKKYRYITCGVVNFEDPISCYRLVGGPMLRNKDSCVRVLLPDNLKLEKCYCDPYSTTADVRKLSELECDILIRINGSWSIRNDLKTNGPFKAYNEMTRRGYHPVPEMGYLTKGQLRVWYARNDRKEKI